MIECPIKNLPNQYKLLKSMFSFDINKGPWLAGGAALKLYKEDFSYESDYDIWFSSEQQLRAVFEKVVNNANQKDKTITSSIETCIRNIFSDDDSKTSKLVHESDNAFTFHVPSIGKVQLIKLIKPTLSELLDDFDITICQVATDCSTIFLTDVALHDINKNVLKLSNINKNSGARLVKYRLYDYKFDNTLVTSLKNDKTFEWSKYDY